MGKVKATLTIRPFRVLYCTAIAVGTVFWLGWPALIPVVLMGIDRDA